MNDRKEALFMKTKTDDHKKPIVLGGIILLVLLIAGIGGLFYWISTLKYVETDDAAIDGNHVSVSAKMLGRIKNLLVDEGAKVEAGQLLIQLDDADLRAQETQSSTGLVSAQANVSLAKVTLKKAQDDFDRSDVQFKAGYVSKEQYDHAQSALDTSKVQYSIAVAQVNNTQAQLGVIQTGLLNTKIIAPISGIIAKRSVMSGEVVQPGQVIFLINDLHRVWVTANFEETKIRLIRPNESVEISVDAYPYHTIKGRVIQVGAAIVPPPFQISDTTKTTQKIPVKILFDRIPDSMALFPGMSVEAKIRVN
jgi:membrane fusion protein (multidrug efflux system)